MAVFVYCKRRKGFKEVNVKPTSLRGYREKGPYLYVSPPPSSFWWGRSELGAALLFAVVVELALPVHHVGGPAVELHLPLTLCLIDVVWRKRRGKHWWAASRLNLSLFT